jgi:hypothetical protein
VILVRPCLWQAVPVLERLQWAHDPERDGPVANASDPEGHIVRACLALSRMLTVADAVPTPDWQVPVLPVVGRVEPLPEASQPGDVHGVPLPPRAFVAREELAALREAVLGAADGAVGVTGAALGLHGQGGIGKTVLAAALARDEAVRRRFPDGIYWVTFGEQGDLIGTQLALLHRLGAAYPELHSAAEGLTALTEVLADRRCLLVVDDVWSAAAAAAFRAAGPAGRVLYTTRDPAVLQGVAAEVVPLGVLSRGVARELLRGLTGVTELPAEADRICAATGGVALVGTAIGAGGRSWAQAAGQLEAGHGTFLDHPYANTFKAMQVGVAGLDHDDERAYRCLAVYPEDTTVPQGAVGRLWAHLLGDSARDTAARLRRLAARSLLTSHEGGFSFHDLQREFLLLHTQDLRRVQLDLLAAYRALLPPGPVRWSLLPPNEPYVWDNLLFHLRSADDGPGIQAVARDLAWLARRCFRSGPYAAESDLRHAATLYPEHEGIGWLLRLLTQWGHLLANHASIGDAPTSVEAGGLDALLPRYYLAPRWGLPRARPGLGRVLEGHSGPVAGVAFSARGQRLASGDHDGTVHLWDAITGQRLGTFRDDTASVTSDGTATVTHMALSPDGVRLATIDHDGKASLWDGAAGELIATLSDGYQRMISLAFSPDGRMLASGNSGSLGLRDLTGGLFGVTAKGWITYVMKRWPALVPESWRPVTLESHYDVTSVAFSPGGRTLASGGAGGEVRLWDPATGQLVLVPEGHSGGSVVSVAFYPDGRLLASCGRDRTVRLWEPGSLEPVSQLRVGAPVTALSWSPAGYGGKWPVRCRQRMAPARRS